MNIRAVIQGGTEINTYIRNMAPSDELLSEYLRQREPGEEEHLGASREDKPLNAPQPKEGSVQHQLEDAGTVELMAKAQELAQSPRAIEAGIYHTRRDLRARLCKESPETIQHTTEKM